jgi:uncharacterized protein YxjI
MKLRDVFDILDATTGQPLGVAREDLSQGLALLRLVLDKRFLPTRIVVAAGLEAPPQLVIEKRFTLFRPILTVRDGAGRFLGRFRGKVFSIGGGFWIEDEGGSPLAEVKGDWKGWNFRVQTPDGRLLATFGRQWGGLAKELFTTADSYVAALEPDSSRMPRAEELLLAAALAIDVVYKEAS